MKLGFDFDGVFSDCGQLKSDGAKKLYGVDIPPAKFKKEIVVGEGLLTMEQYRELQNRIYGTPAMGLLMKPVEGVLQFFPQLIREGHSGLVVTSRGEKELEIARMWSIQQGLKIDFVGVGYGNCKSGATRGLDFYVDDDLDKLEPLIGIVPNLFLFSWGYNKHVETGPAIKRVASWADLYRIIQILKGAS